MPPVLVSPAVELIERDVDLELEIEYADAADELDSLLRTPGLTFVEGKDDQGHDALLLRTHFLAFGDREDLKGGDLVRMIRGDEVLQEHRVVPVPRELYLRSFLDLDVADPAQVRDFCAAFGPVGRGDWPEDAGVPSDWPTYPSAVAGYEGEPPLLGMAVALGGVQGEFDVPPGSLRRVYETRWIGEVAAYQSFLRDLRNLWDVVTGGRSFESLLADWVSDRWGWPAPTCRSGIRDGVEQVLEEGLNPALGPYHVRVSAHAPDVEGMIYDHNVYSAMCLQLANKIATGAPFRRCRNEKCGRLFDEKESFASKPRSGGRTNYCSVECANAQTQRDFRRRRRDARRAQNP